MEGGVEKLLKNEKKQTKKKGTNPLELWNGI
jgi:hypothetical protein